MKNSSHNRSCSFYEIVEAPYDSHWLLEMANPEEYDELTRSLRFGRPLPVYSPPLMFTISDDGKLMDFSFTAMGIMVVSEKAEEVLRREASSDIQLIPAIIQPLQGRFSVAHVVTKLDCVDHERSTIVQLE